MALELNPSIVWTRDESARSGVLRWHRCLDERAQQFVRMASSWEEVRDALRVYAAEEFSTVLRDCGVTLASPGIVINVVLVASGMGPEAYNEGSVDSDRLRQLGLEVSGIKKHLVLIARHADLPPKQRVLAVPRGFPIPWLVSSRGSDMRTRNVDAVDANLARLLDALVLTSPRGKEGDPTALQEFAKEHYAQDHVRMAGYTQINFEWVVAEIARGCSASMMTRCRSTVHAAPHAAQKLLESADTAVAMLVRGDLDVAGFLARVIGDQGLLRWNAQTILVEAPSVLEKLTGDRSALALTACGISPSHEYANLAPRAPWWRRLLVALGSLRHPKVASTPATTGQQAECEAVLARLRLVRSFLEAVNRKGNGLGDSNYRPPEGSTERWLKLLNQELHQGLHGLADLHRTSVPDIDSILRDLDMWVEMEVASNLLEAITEWSRGVAEMADVRSTLSSENLIVFDAPIAAGTELRTAAAIGAFRFGDAISIHNREVPYAWVTTWSGVRPYFVVASSPVNVKYLCW